MKRLAEFIKSVLAGLMVSIGATTYLSCDNKYIGALLFSVGLITIVTFRFNLYTGRIGYIFEKDKLFFIDTMLSILGNLVGCVIIGLIVPSIGNVVNIVTAKLSKSPLEWLIDGIFCGILIYVCVEIYKRKNTVVGILFCIPAFILCGFEHSIANMFYFANARTFDMRVIFCSATVIIANALGSFIIPLAIKLSKKLEHNQAIHF